MKYLTYRDRIVIETLVKRNASVAEIAAHLGRCRQTIYNELKRGALTLVRSDLTEYQSYSADIAQQKHEYAQTAKGRPLKIGKDHAFAAFLQHKIKKERFSPAAALASARSCGRFDTSVCAATLYSYIYKGVLDLSRRDLLRSKPPKGKKAPLTPPKVLEAPSIDDRPDWINDRSELGHWEMDCVCSKQGRKPALLVLTERASRYELIFKIPNKETKTVVGILNRLEDQLGPARFRDVFRSITVDNGAEFRDYAGLRADARTEIYYCHPYRSGERGSNENCNSIIRRWFPKGTDFTDVTDEDVQRVQDWINHYPRNILGWCCAADFGIAV